MGGGVLRSATCRRCRMLRIRQASSRAVCRHIVGRCRTACRRRCATITAAAPSSGKRRSSSSQEPGGKNGITERAIFYRHFKASTGSLRKTNAPRDVSSFDLTMKWGAGSRLGGFGIGPTFRPFTRVWIEMTLAQANGTRRDFHKLIILDIGDGLFQTHAARRN